MTGKGKTSNISLESCAKLIGADLNNGKTESYMINLMHRMALMATALVLGFIVLVITGKSPNKKLKGK